MFLVSIMLFIVKPTILGSPGLFSCKSIHFQVNIIYLPSEHVAKSSLLENSSRPFCLDHLFELTTVVCFFRGDLLCVLDRCDGDADGDDDGDGDDDDDDDVDIVVIFSAVALAVGKCANTSVVLLSSIRSETKI